MIHGHDEEHRKPALMITNNHEHVSGSVKGKEYLLSLSRYAGGGEFTAAQDMGFVKRVILRFG
jgi:hypothetical protein